MTGNSVKSHHDMFIRTKLKIIPYTIVSFFQKSRRNTFWKVLDIGK